MIEEPAKGDPVEVARWMQAERVSLFQTVPSFGEQIMQAIEFLPAEIWLPHLEHLAVAGEVLKESLAETFLKNFGRHATLHNLYGPN